MTLRSLLVLMLLAFGADAPLDDLFDRPLIGGGDGTAQGRRGNAFFEQENYASAADAYRQGLQALEGEGAEADSVAGDARPVYAALQNNLGAALHRQEQFADARTAFDAAHRAAGSREERVRALYNAGNASAGMGELEAALRYYRQALLLNPTHQPARHNFEVLKRQLQKRQQQRGGGSPPDVEPSAYAQQLKQRADALVARRQYGDALSLMNEGLAQDSTVRAYQRFIRRLEDVTGILRGGSAAR